MKKLKYVKLFENFDNKNNVDELINYIENNSSLVFNNDKEEETLIFATRKHGDTSTDTYSEIDYKECVELIKVLRVKFPNYSYSIETVDEWVDINATKKDFYKGYEPKRDDVGYVLSYVRKDGRGHSFETRSDYGPHSGREKHQERLKELAERFIIDKTPEEVLEIADSLSIPGPYKYSEKVLIQKAHNSNDEKYDTIPDADFYVQRREIW